MKNIIKNKKNLFVSKTTRNTKEILGTHNENVFLKTDRALSKLKFLFHLKS